LIIRALLALATASVLLAYRSGPPVRRTGAPGDRTCLDANCHVGERFPESPLVTLDTGTNSVYRAGGPKQQWSIRIDDSTARAYGIEVSTRMASEPARLPAGRMFSISPLTMVVCEDDALPGPEGCGSRTEFFHHTEPAASGRFALEWQPPPAGNGDIEVYVAANASVAGQRNSRIHLVKFTLRAGDPEPGLVNAASLTQRFSSNSWVRITGSGLAASTRDWLAADTERGELPVELDGVSVRINGRAAAIAQISPERILALAPDDETEGSAPVEVTRNGAVTHRFTAAKARLAPALFAPRDPARSGALIGLYGTGFGTTDPPVPPGTAFTGAAPLSKPFRVSIAGRNVLSEFGGLIAPGLYQFNVQAPDLEPGVYPVTVEIDGERTPPLLLPVIR
jgi:uncharacterized protein (TIGR03437 family)